MLRVGLTGGIGAGKSTVSARLASKGAVIVDADLIAREVVEPGTPGLAALVAEFGEDILLPDGALDRPALAARAFATDEARSRLNAITHPLVGARTAELLAAAPADAVVVQDIPLLVEAGMAPAFHLVVVVNADEEVRVRRLTEFRGIPETDARARIAAQATEEQRRAAADVWLDNNGAPDALIGVVDELWDARLEPFEQNLRSARPVDGDAQLMEARPGWAGDGRRAEARVRLACGAAAGRVDHVGATAVPELPAPDVIEVQVTVPDFGRADELSTQLAGAGFVACPAEDHDGKRVHRGCDPARPVVVQMCLEQVPEASEELMLRDWLRADVAARAEYRAAVTTAAGAREWQLAHRGQARAWADANGWSFTAN